MDDVPWWPSISTDQIYLTSFVEHRHYSAYFCHISFSSDKWFQKRRRLGT